MHVHTFLFYFFLELVRKKCDAEKTLGPFLWEWRSLADCFGIDLLFAFLFERLIVWIGILRV